MSAVIETAKKWESENSVMKVNCPPPYIIPLSVKIETDDCGKIIKKRPCIDVSRCLNKYLPKIKTRLDTLENTEHLITKI